MPVPTRWRIPVLVAFYAILAGLWIYLSDKFLALLATDPAGLTHLQTFKGWGFVAVTAAMLAIILSREARARAARDRALRESEETYRTLVEVETDALVLIENATGQILAANPAAAQLYGYTPQELLGLRNTDLSAEPAETSRVTTGTPIAPETIVRIPLRYHKKRDGIVFPVEISGRFFTWHERPVHLAAIRDITERQRAEATLARYQLLADQARDIVLFVRQDGRILEANQAAIQAYGYPLEEIVRLNIQDLRAPETQALTVEQLTRADTDGILFETAHRRKDGSTFPVEVSSRGAEHAGERILLSIVRDIADRKRAEHALATRSRQVEAVQAITAEITRELDLERLLALIHQHAIALMGVSGGSLYLWDEASQVLIPHVWHGIPDTLGTLHVRPSEGLVGTVASRRAGVAVNDYRTSPLAHPRFLAETGIVAALAEPLLYRERLVGVIVLNNQQPGRTFAAEDQALLALFAQQAAIAIENARLFRDEHDRRAQIEALRATTADLTRELDLTRLLRLLIARAAELVGASSGTVYLWEPEAGMVVPAAWHGLGDWQAALRHPLGQGVAGTVAETRQGVLANDYRASRYANPVSLERTAVTASLGEPLLYREELIGALTLNHEGGRTFTEQDQTLLRLFADQAAIAIANARLFREEHMRRAQLEAVRAVSAEITQELELAKVLRLVARRACELTGGTVTDIDLWDPERRLLIPEASYGYAAPPPRTMRRLGEGAMGTVAQTRHGMILNDYRSSPIAHPDTLAHTTITASVVEPLLYRDTLLGVIGVDHQTVNRTFTTQDRDLLRLFADQAAIAIANARLFQNQQGAYVALQQAQEELVRSEKLRGLGQMAAGIAHDLNNMLATILGQTELLRLRARDPEIDEGLQTLQTAANDGAQVVRRLQDFARQRAGGPLSRCDLKLLVTETLEITRPRWQEEPRRKGIVIQTSVDLAGIPLIQGNPAEIREALTNLIFNAVDAMPNGGSLGFTGCVHEMSGERSQARLPDASPSRGEARPDLVSQWVDLAVSDTGVGMTEEVRRRIFDPFFTTKGLHGTGLGLSVVYGIMERHGGQIYVTSEHGHGAAFHLRFRPAGEGAEGPAGCSMPAVVPSRRILVVDDDAAVRQTLAALLRASGQEVIEADSGAAGLRCLETTRLDLVLTDLGMPEITGWDVARAAKSRDASLPVVLLTGWGDQVGAEAPADTCVDRVLTKPVLRSTLLRVIAELTGRR